jgi:hypothetical protein
LIGSSVSEKANLQRVDAFRKWTAEVFYARTLSMTVSNLGKVKRVNGFGDEAWDTWRSKIGEIIADRAERAQLDAQVQSVFGDDSVARVFTMAFFIGLPPQEMAVGQEWSDSTEFAYGATRLPMTRHYKLLNAANAGRTIKISERILYAPPVVPQEISVRQNENLMTAEITLDPTAGTILTRTYVGLADMDIFRRDPATPLRVSRSVTSVRGTVTIATSSREELSTRDAALGGVADSRASGAYSANVLWSSSVSGAGQRARLYARGHQMRLEPLVAAGQEQFYLLVDKDREIVTAVFPSRRVYTRESTVTGTGPWANYVRQQGVVFNSAAPCALFPAAASCNYVGEGTLLGRGVRTWEVTQAVDGRIPVGHVWMDSRLAVILKAETPGGVIELQNIQEGEQRSELFAVPQTYTQARQ